MLEDLGKMHNIWVAMARNLGVPAHLAEDLIQEMYIRLNKYVKDESKIYYKNNGPEGINRFYVWMVIRNMAVSMRATKAKNVTLYLDDCLESEEDRRQIEDISSRDKKEADKERARDRLTQKVEKEVEGWEHHYDKKLFNLYYMSQMSMRSISSGTGISLTSIFNSCKNYKENILDEFSEDWEDFKNGEFDLI